MVIVIDPNWQKECFIKMLKEPSIKCGDIYFWFDNMLSFSVDTLTFQRIAWWKHDCTLRYIDSYGYAHNECPKEALRAYEQWVIETTLLGE